MKIFEENGKIRLQLKDLKRNKMLFDFTVDKEDFEEVRTHIIEHLDNFEV